MFSGEEMYRCIVLAMSCGVMGPETAFVIVSGGGRVKGAMVDNFSLTGPEIYLNMASMVCCGPRPPPAPDGRSCVEPHSMSELQLYMGRDDETIYCRYFRTAVLRHAFLHQ